MLRQKSYDNAPVAFSENVSGVLRYSRFKGVRRLFVGVVASTPPRRLYAPSDNSGSVASTDVRVREESPAEKSLRGASKFSVKSTSFANRSSSTFPTAASTSPGSSAVTLIPRESLRPRRGMR